MSRPVPQVEGIDDFPPGDEGYHNYAEMVAEVQAVAAAHPQTVHLFSLGTSYEGRDLIGARVSDDATDNLSEPGVFYVGQHHAREHLTVEVVLSLLHLYADRRPHATNQISTLVRTRQIYIVPSLNPDGAEYDIAGGSYRYWRKNRQPNPDAIGTDNNRNYSYRWGCCGGSSGNGGSETYRGPSPLSAPENQRMADFMIAHPNVTTGISYHTYGDLILYPYGYTYEDEPPDMDHVDHQTFVAMGAAMEATAGTTRSSRPTCTSRTATGRTGCTARSIAARSRSRCGGASPTGSARPTRLLHRSRRADLSALSSTAPCTRRSRIDSARGIGRARDRQALRAAARRVHAARNELAKRLAKDGEKERADEVRGLAKPSVPVWAINQLARAARSRWCGRSSTRAPSSGERRSRRSAAATRMRSARLRARSARRCAR